MGLRINHPFPVVFCPQFGSMTPYEPGKNKEEDIANAKDALCIAGEKTAFLRKTINGVRYALTGQAIIDEFLKNGKTA